MKEMTVRDLFEEDAIDPAFLRRLELMDKTALAELIRRYLPESEAERVLARIAATRCPETDR